MVVAALACGVACFHPNAAQDQPCSPDGFCPSGQHCDVTQLPPTCVAGDGGAIGGDARGVDAPVAKDGMMVSCAGGCPSDQPICDTGDDTCRGCVADAECPSLACEESTGACIAAGSAIFVATTGTDGGACTAAAPCATVTYALTLVGSGRGFIAIAAGTYHDSFLVPASVATTLSGPSLDPSAAEIDYAATGSGIDHVIEITGAAQVVVEGLTIANDATVEGIRMSATAGKLQLSRVAVTKCAGGLDLRGTIAISQCEIHDNPGIGIAFATGGVLDVERTRISGNSEGVQISTGDIIVRNSFILRSSSHAVHVTGGANTTLSFDTIADNELGGSDDDIAVECGSGATGPLIEDTIVANNGNGTNQLGCGGVNYVATTGDPTNGGGTGNFHVEYPGLFANPSMGDYHLAPHAAPIDLADPAATLMIDFDGQLRPQGPRCDVGADEAQ